MAFVPVPNTIEVVLHGSCGGAQWSNVYHVKSSSAITGPEQVEDALGNVALAYINEIAPNISGDCDLESGTARDLTAADSYTVEDTFAGDGGYVGATLPPGSAAVVTWRTGIAGRAYRGRTFLCGIPEEVVDASGDLQSAYKADLQAGVDAFLTAVNAGTAGQVLAVAAKYYVDPPNTPPQPRTPAFSTEITAGVVRTYIHSQRRRNLRG